MGALKEVKGFLTQLLLNKLKQYMSIDQYNVHYIQLKQVFLNLFNDAIVLVFSCFSSLPHSLHAVKAYWYNIYKFLLDNLFTLYKGFLNSISVTSRCGITPGLSPVLLDVLQVHRLCPGYSAVAVSCLLALLWATGKVKG